MIFRATFRSALITTLARAPELKTKRHLTPTSLMLSLIVPVHISAIRLLNLVSQSSVRSNIKQVEAAIREDDLSLETVEQMLFGHNAQLKQSLQDVLKVRLVRFELDGEIIESPMITSLDYQIADDKPLSLLINGAVRDVALAEDQTSITLRPPASVGPASERSRPSDLPLSGIAAAPGYGFGSALLWQSWSKGLEIKKYSISEDQVETEIERFMAARLRAESVIQAEICQSVFNGHKELTEVLETYKMMITDASLADKVARGIRSKRLNAEFVLEGVIASYIRQFEKIADDYMRARINDFRDLGNRILRGFSETEDSQMLAWLEDDVIIVADELSPADISALQSVKDRIKGLVIGQGGPTSHAAIIARSLGLPALVGVTNAMRLIRNNDQLAIHGNDGVVVINPGQASLTEFMDKQRVFGLLMDKINCGVAGKANQTGDGTRVFLEGNVATNDEVPLIAHYEGEGVGLYRTEFLYLNRDRAPSEDELAQIFANIHGPAKVRTFDIGGDKTLADYMPYISPEDSSFLGLRGIRLYFHDQWWSDMFKTQIRAILRASARRPGLSIMFPMISRAEELRRANQVVAEAKAELDGNFNPEIKVGVMIEVPSAVSVADELAAESDFFSIGTNDLVQYTLGIARENTLVAHLYDPFHRAVLHNFDRAIRAAKAEGIPVGVCGALAASPLGAALLVGMGADSLSMPPADIPMIKYALSGLPMDELRVLVSAVLNNGSSGSSLVEDAGRKRVVEHAREALSLESFERLSFLERLRGQPI